MLDEVMSRRLCDTRLLLLGRSGFVRQEQSDKSSAVSAQMCFRFELTGR